MGRNCFFGGFLFVYFLILQIRKASCGKEAACAAQTGGIHGILFEDLLMHWDDNSDAQDILS